MRKIVVLAAAAVLVFGLSASSWAATEFDFGVSIRTNVQWNQINKDRAEAQGLDDSGVGNFTVNMANGGRSRLYANAKLDDFSARVEIRTWDGRQIRADRASATWNFAEGMYFLFGFDSDLVDLHWSDAVMGNNANYGFGAIGDNKETQLQIGGKGENYSWGVAIAQAYTSGLNGNVTTEVTQLPRFEGIAKYAPMESFDLGASAWYQTTDLRRGLNNLSDKSVSEYGFNGRIRYFSDLVNVGVGGFWGKNLGISGVSGHPGWTAGVGGLQILSNSVKDVDGYGALITFSFPIEPVTLGVGGGFERTDSGIRKGTAGVTRDTWTQWNFYVNVLYNFTDNFFIIPEFFYADYGKSFAGVKQGNEWILGARLQADF